MDLSFDIRGNLKPYEKMQIPPDEFREVFVTSFEVDSSRHQIFENYRKYTEAFKNQIKSEFTQWIDGSFVTNKKNPKDIDLVTLIDYQLYEKHEIVIKQDFIKEAVPKKYQIDAYLVVLYPEDHKFYSRTRSDLLYWEHWFTKSKLSKNKKRHPKGFVEIIYNYL